MKRRRVRAPVLVILALLAVGVLVLWQWQALARLAIVAGVRSVAHVALSFDRMTLTRRRAVFDEVRVRALDGEPIASIARLSLTYDLRDLLPGGKRLFGLESVTAEAPHFAIVRHSDGSYNVPLPQLAAKNRPAGPPLIARVRVRGGTIEVLNESASAPPNERRLFVGDLDVDADVSSAARSVYRVDLRYGERRGQTYPVRGRGEIDFRRDYSDQRWTAARLPVAAAADFIVNSRSLRLESGTLRNVEVRYFAMSKPNASLEPHLSGGAQLEDGRLSIAGLDAPVAGVRGPLDLYDDGLLASHLVAAVAGAAARVDGGIYHLKNPHLRVAIRGSGELARLSAVIAQARHLPLRGRLDFGLLVEGSASAPLTWVDLRAPRIGYASTSLERVSGLAAFDNDEADVVDFTGNYRGAALVSRGRLGFRARPQAVEMLLSVRAPPGAIPYAGAALPGVSLDGVALATADDPKAVGVRGILSGAGAGTTVEGVFAVDARGRGSIGPIEVREPHGSLYARVALDRPRALAAGYLRARNFAVRGASLDATIFGGAEESALGFIGAARAAGPWGAGEAHGTVASQHGALVGAVFGRANDSASFAADVRGTLRSPRLTGTVVVAGGRYKSFDVNGSAGVAFANGTLHVRDAAVALGPLFIGARGSVTDLLPAGASAPRYDLVAELHSSDVNALLAAVRPQAAGLVQGSVDADLHVGGAGMRPSFGGVVRAPEGSVNGLAFRDFESDVSGDAQRVSLSGSRVVVGSTGVSFNGEFAAEGSSIELDAPRADLADFNDFFDQGDMFAGRGSLALQAGVRGRQIVSSSGSARFTGARYRQIELGDVAADWSGSRGSIATDLSISGTAGTLRAAGSIEPAAMALNLRAQARDVDLGTWLPMLGFGGLPMTGRLDAQTTLSGRYPDLAMQLHATLAGGTAGHLPIERFEVTAAASHGRGTIQSAVLDLPSLTNVASGSFGLRAGDALALTVHSMSPDVGAFLNRATRKDFGVTGALDSTLRVLGTRAQPQLRDSITLLALRRGDLTIPRVRGEIDADPRMVEVRNGEIDLTRGRALIAARVPIRLERSGISPAPGPIAASLVADDVELSNFASLLPKGTQLSGRVDGRIAAGGSVDRPQLEGLLALSDGAFSGPMERSPITGIAGSLAFAGSRATLQSHATVGSGSLALQADAAVANLRRLQSVAFSAQARAANARLDVPGYLTGNLDGEVSVTHESSAGPPSMSGEIAISNARIDPAALIDQKNGGPSKTALPDVAFSNLRIAAANGVRLQSRNIDIGAVGDVTLGGKLSAPTLTGSFRSTGGTLSFYRTFNLESGLVRFDGSSIVPDVSAVATTYVPDPPTAIRLHVTGPATSMNLALASDPSYDRQQILGLLVGAQQFGAVRGVASSGGGGFSAGGVAQQFALGQVNTLFTRTMLEPLSASVAGALGFTSVQITSNVQTGLGVNATKAFGKTVTAVYSQTFGYPKIQAITLEARPRPATGLRMNWYTATGPTLFALQQPQPVGMDVLNLNRMTLLPPLTGTNGIDFSYVRRYP